MINEVGISDDLCRGYYLRLGTTAGGVPEFSSNSSENIPEIKIRLKRSRAPKER